MRLFGFWLLLGISSVLAVWCLAATFTDIRDPFKVWATLGRPLPKAGDVWCATPYGDPWDARPLRRVVLEVKDGWLRYAVGEKNGWEHTSEVWIFQANYRPCRDGQ